MKKLRFLILLAPIMLTTCDDEKVDAIWHTDVEPDKTVTSMIPSPATFEDLAKNGIAWTNGVEQNGTYNAAWAWMTFDLNKDENADFGFEVRHAYQYGSTDPGDEFVIYIETWQNKHEISLSDQAKGYVKKYSFGDVIDFESFGAVPVSQTSSCAYLVRKNPQYNLDNNGEFYIAVKMNVDNKPFYGWFLVETKTDVLTLTVKEFALSKVSGQKITIGQKD